MEGVDFGGFEGSFEGFEGFVGFLEFVFLLLEDLFHFDEVFGAFGGAHWGVLLSLCFLWTGFKNYFP